MHKQQHIVDCHWGFLPAYKHLRKNPQRRIELYRIGRHRADWNESVGEQQHLLSYLHVERNLDHNLLSVLSYLGQRPDVKRVLAKHWYFPLDDPSLSKSQRVLLTREACLLLQLGLGNYFPC
jgi:hypothetical protein